MPIHLMWGDDLAATHLAIESLIEKVVDPAWKSINISRLDGTDIGQASQSLIEVRTPPFGSGDRVVLVKQSPFCNGCSNELAQCFEEVLELIPKNTHLVLNNKNKPDGRLRTTKRVQSLLKTKFATETSFILPAIWDETGQRNLVERTARELGLEIEHKAISLLVEAIGNDSQRIMSELTKVALLSDVQKNNSTNSEKRVFISAKNVSDLVEGNTTNSLKVGESLLMGDFGEALVRIKVLLEQGEPALRILATVTGQVRGWLWISLLDQKGEKDVSVIAKAAGIANPKRIYVMRKQMRGKQPKEFLTLLNSLLEIESALKKGVLPGDAFKDGLLADKSL